MPRKDSHQLLEVGILTPRLIAHYAAVSVPTVRSWFRKDLLKHTTVSGRGKGEVRVTSIDFLEFAVKNGYPAHPDIILSAARYATTYFEGERYEAIRTELLKRGIKAVSIHDLNSGVLADPRALLSELPQLPQLPPTSPAAQLDAAQ